MMKDSGEIIDINQAPSLLEIMDDFTFSTKMESKGFVSNGIWQVDDSLKFLSLTGVFLNNKKIENPITHRNEIILLTNKELYYTYEDSFTETTLFLEYVNVNSKIENTQL